MDKLSKYPSISHRICLIILQIDLFYDLHILSNYFLNIKIFLDNVSILFDKVFNLPSILTNKYMDRAIGKPTLVINSCKLSSIKLAPYSITKS